MGVLLTLAWRENGLMKWNIFVKPNDQWESCSHWHGEKMDS